MGGDRFITDRAPLPGTPAASFFDTTHICRTANTVAVAASFGTAAAGLAAAVAIAFVETNNCCLRCCNCCCSCFCFLKAAFCCCCCCCRCSCCCCAYWGRAASGSREELSLFDPGNPPSNLPLVPLHICPALYRLLVCRGLLAPDMRTQGSERFMDGNRWPPGEIEHCSPLRTLKTIFPQPSAATHALYWYSMWEAAGSLDGEAGEAAADPGR